MKKRILSMILTFCAMISLQAAVSAAPELETEVESALETQTQVEQAEEDDALSEALAVESESVSYLITNGKTDSFQNISVVAQDIVVSGGDFDYVIYYKDGSIQTYKANQGSKYTLTVPAEGKTVITAVKNNINVTVPDDYFIIEEEEHPVFHKIDLKVYDTYSFTNTSNVAYKVLSRTSGRFDYVLYDADGNVTEYKRNTYGDIEVPAGYTLKVTQTEYTQELNALYEKFDVTEVAEPVMKKIKMSAGDTYSFTNTSNVAYKVLYSYSYSDFDYVLYDGDGNVTEYKRNTTRDIEVPAGYTLKVTQTKYTQELNALYEKFDVTEVADPVMKKIKMSAGDTYSFTNTSNVAYKVLYYYYSGVFDYVLYYSNGKVKETGNRVCKDIEVPGGGSVKITALGTQEFHALDEIFTVVNDGIDFPSFKVLNTDTVDAELDGKDGCSFDYAIYDADGILSSYGIGCADTVTIPKGGYALTTVSTSLKQPFEDNAALSVEAYETPVYKATYLEPGEICRYTNTGSRELRVYQTGIACEYVIHNADHSIESYGINASDEYFTVPVGGSICIASHNYIRLKALSAYFSEEAVTQDIFDIVHMELGKTYQTTNNGIKDMSLFVNGVLDYVIYNADDSIHSYMSNCTSEKVEVPAGTRIVITPRVAHSTLALLKESFSTATERNYPVFKRIHTYFRDEITMNNAADVDLKFFVLPDTYVDYTTYDAGDNVQKGETLVTCSELSVPANGRVEITMRASNAILAGLYEHFSDEDLSVAVTGITLSENELTLVKGKQKMLTATVTPSDATNKAVIWSSSAPTVVAVAQTGKITAKAVGTATVTAKTADGNYSATCRVTVTETAPTTVSVTGVTLNKTSTTLTVGDTETLTATVAPGNATNKSVTWSSSNTSVATVANGVVTAKAAGSTTITVKTADGSKTATCTVSVKAQESVKPVEPADPNAPAFVVSSVKGTAGSTVSVTLSLKNNPGIVAAKVKLAFDTKVLTLKEVKDAGVLGSAMHTPSLNSPYTLYWFNGTATENYTVNGVAATLVFEIKDSAAVGHYAVTASTDSENIYNADMDEVEFITVSGEVEVIDVVLGDLNGDDKVNVKDNMMLARYLAEWPDYDESTVNLAAADLNGDGKVNVKDNMILARHLAEWPGYETLPVTD